MDSNVNLLATGGLRRLIVDHRRRAVLVQLRKRGTKSTAVRDPAAAVDAEERAGATSYRYEPTGGVDDRVRRILAEFRHDHLPRLANAGRRI